MLDLLVVAGLGLAIDTCTDYDAAVAAATAIDSKTVLCGVSVDADQVRVHHPDGRSFPVSGDMFPLGFGRNCEADCDRNVGIAASEFWVYDVGSTKVIGLRNMNEDTVYLISRDESGDRGWYARRFDCGRYPPPAHFFPYTPESGYVLAGNYGEVGVRVICALHTHQGEVETQWFEEEMGSEIHNYSISALSVSGWNCGGQEEFDRPVFCMTITAPDGRELFRSESPQGVTTPPTGTA